MSEPSAFDLPLSHPPWQIKVRSVGHSGGAGRIEAAPADREALARALDILACDRLVVDYRMSPSGRDRFRVSGHIDADIVQACVATLEPVPERIDEDFDVAFWPAEDLGQELPEGEIHLDEERPEPIMHGEIALGHLIYELIAVAMDPFPRSPAAPASDAEPSDASAAKPDSPFAALAKLKQPR
ncbi:MAG: DUF177 domain-containing protein [Hyphomicrobiaceae bacterium]